MGYIQIPKLISGGGDEPVINVREMPQEWQYFTSLKESDKDQAYLFYKGGSNNFNFSGMVYFPNISYATLYGGTNGTTPLYRCYWGSSLDRYWARYENGTWIRNTNQPSLMTIFDLKQADLDNYSDIFPLSLAHLTGKPITNDAHLGTTELFTFIVHTNDNNYTKTYLTAGSSYGGTTSNSVYTIPLVAYSGGAYFGKSSNNVRIPELEFVEILGGDEVMDYSISSANWLGKVSLPDSVTTIGTNAFQDCVALQEAKLPANILAIPDNTFNGCVNLKKVTLPTAYTSIGSNTFADCINLKNMSLASTLLSLGEACFARTGLETVNFPSGLTTMGAYCFQATNIVEAMLPSTLTTADSSTFSTCKKLKKVRIPSSLTVIPQSMFISCTALENVIIEQGVQTLSANLFNGCSSLKNLELPSSVQTISNNVFTSCVSLREIAIPTGCTLGTYSFSNCYNLEKVTLPTDLIAIPNNCFQNCRGVQEWNLPETLETIGNASFQNNWIIQKMIIPASVTNISATAFGYLGSCKYFKMLGATPTLANASAFGNGNTYAKILVPYDYIHSYRTSTNWSSSTNSIKNKQRGYKTFTQGDTLPSTDSSGSHTLKWYENLEDILSTTATGTPTATPITVAPYDGEFYCTITG